MLKAIKAFFSENVPVMETMEQTIEKIHNEFDTAGEKLLAEAKNILAREDDTSKGDRLKSLGFTQCASAELASKIKLEKAQSKETAERVQYFQQHYPSYKFITEPIVAEICKKYNLVCAEVAYYKGDVPEKNVAEMEAFKLRDEDKKVQSILTDQEYEYMRSLAMLGSMNMNRPQYKSALTTFHDERDNLFSFYGIGIGSGLAQMQAARPRAGQEISQKQWNEAEEWQRQSAVTGVLFRFDNPDATEDSQHNAWMKDKTDAGWVYGETKDAEAKTHPCIIPFNELPEFQQKKDKLFCAIVDALK